MTNTPKIPQLIDHFFRQESGKMIAVLTGVFGTNNLVLAEDIVQDTLVEAMSNWQLKGVPDNPVAWLYSVAKNKTLNALKREQYQETYAEQMMLAFNRQQTEQRDQWDPFSEESMADDQLRLMFMCCHASISKDSQIALILKTLCGFSIGEIAKAFLTNNESISKRLVRVRKAIREDEIPFAVPEQNQLDSSVDAVLEAIYLLFNEGYSASTGDQIIRKDLCNESIRLAEIMVQHKAISNKTNVYALLALMQLNAARFEAREGEDGAIITLKNQDRSKWNLPIMERGFVHLEKAAHSQQISKYHILAAISAYHCSARDFAATDWQSIVVLYDKLQSIDASAAVSLNRAIALFHAGDSEQALQDLAAIEEDKMMQSNYLFYAVKADFEKQQKQLDKARHSLQKAIDLAPISPEKQLLQNRFKNYFKN